jgi:hypothetical protein
MPLPELFTPGAWAIVPSTLEQLYQVLLNAATPGAEQASPPPQAALPSSAGDGRPAEIFILQGGGAKFVDCEVSL